MSEVNPNFELEIAHVLFVDVVGYSKLLIDDQRELQQQLNEIVHGTEQFRVGEAAGKLVRLPTGDGIGLVFFNTEEAPVKCALEISEALQSYPQLQLRMGINTGPVSGVLDVNGQSNIAGVGINLAQRIMDIGDAGHILLSKRVADDLAEYRHWKPHLYDLGEVEVKHGAKLSLVNLHTEKLGNAKIPEKLKQQRKQASTRLVTRTLIASLLFLVLALLIGALIILRWLPSRLPGSSAALILEKSIAVLPFENLSEEKQNAFFAEGVQDQILTDLAKVADLKVISRTSVMQYKNAATRNLREIAQQLGVTHVLEGSVQRAGGKVRVNAQLINAHTDAHEWAEHYDRPIDDVFAIQSDLADKITTALKAKLSTSEKSRLEHKPTENGEAYLAFVQAHNLQLNREDFDKLKQAEQLYERALRMDPDFVLASAELSRLESWIAHSFDPTPVRREKARSLAHQALKLQPDCPECHLALGFAYYYGDRDYEKALKEFAIAQRGLPNEAEVFLATAAVQRRQGKWTESNANFEKAVNLNPNETWGLQNFSFNYQRLRNFDTAKKTIDRALKVTPESLDLWKIQADSEIAEKGSFEMRDHERKLLSTSPVSEKEKAPLTIAIAQTLLLERKYAEALREAESIKDELLTSELQETCSKYTAIGFARKMLKDETGAREALLSAKATAERYLNDAPNEAPRHARLAHILALLGEKEAAIAEATKATVLLPESVDAFEGANMAQTLAEVYALVGEPEKAIDLLDGLLSRPSPVTVALLKINPTWDSLRKNPRFSELLKKYGGSA